MNTNIDRNSLTGQQANGAFYTIAEREPMVNLKIDERAYRKIFLTNRRLIYVLILFCCFLAISAVLIHLFVGVWNSKLMKADCSWNETSLIDSKTVSTTDSFCSRKFTISEFCSKRNKNDWRFLSSNNSLEWKKLSNNIEELNFGEIQSVFLSPFYTTPNETCGIIFSLNSIKNATIIIRSTNHKHYAIKKLLNQQEGCNHIYHSNLTFYKDTKIIQLIILSSLTKNNLSIRSFSVDFQHCNEFFTIENTPVFDLHPQKINKNRCSLEYLPHIDCDWMKLRSNDVTKMFQHVQQNDCTKRGLVSIPEGEKWFLSMSSTSSSNTSQVTSSYIISPLIERSTNHVMLSYYYQMSNNLSNINVYVSERYFDLKLLKKFSAPSSQINTPSNDWNREQIQIAVPAELDFFHIIIEGILKEEKHSTTCLALDDVTITTVHDICLKDSGDFLNCAFQIDESSSFCRWKASGDPEYDNFDWDIIHSGWESYKLLESHLKDRGFILKLEGVVGEDYVYFRSPLVLANSNCSCYMSMMYLMRGMFAPRFTVVLVHGEDQNSRSRPYTTLWSEFGHQGDEWVNVKIVVPLRNDGVPFQVEIRASEIADARGNAYIDDIKFDQCDLNFYSEAIGDPY